MKGWGRVRVLGALGLCFWLAVGCGGRTDSFDDYTDDEGGGDGAVGANGGMGPTAGTPNKGGSKPTGGKGGKGGSSTGGAPIGGSGPVGGVGAGGSFNPFGGSTIGGFGGTISFGGFGGFGGTVIGGFGGGSPDCQTCLLRSCSTQFIECIQDIGCVSIIACAQSTGCQGLECYRDEFCKDVIDQWGGPAGSSMNELLQTVACAANSGCGCFE